MVTDNSGLGPCMVVVGAEGAELVYATRHWTREGQIEVVACADVYRAVVRLAQRAGRRLLIVGTMQELGRENGAFFRLAAAHGVPCCCLLDVTGPAARAGLHAALQTGVTILDAVPAVRGALQEWLSNDQRAAAVARLVTSEPIVPPGAGTRLVASDVQCPTERALPPRHPGLQSGAPEVDQVYEEFRATEAELSALLE